MIGRKKNAIAMFAICLGLAMVQSNFAASWDESVDGDLGGSGGTLPTPFALDSGFGVPVMNLVTGTVGVDPVDPIDAVDITLPDECSLEVFLVEYNPTAPNTQSQFYVVDDTGTTIGQATVDAAAIGSDLVAAAVEPDLEAGEYSIFYALFELGTPGNEYVLDFQCTCPVPEPNAFVLLGFGMLAFVGSYRKKA